MTKQEFYAASQPSNLQIVNKDMYGDESLIITGISFDDVICKYGRTPIKFTTPIIRPLDSLVEECVQADYNDGKPFVPIEILGKRYNSYGKYEDGLFGWDSPTGGDDYQDYYYVVDLKTLQYQIYCGSPNEGGFCIEKQNLSFSDIQQLLKWHFWPNMPEGEEVVLVTETFNPYK